MQKWRIISSLAILSASLFAFAPTSSEAQCCEPCDCDGFFVGADFLWWKPTVGDLNYCAKREGSNFRLKNFCPCWEPGLRVYLGKYGCCCDWGFGASYTYIKTCDSAKTTLAGDILPTYTHPGFTISVGDFDTGKGSWHSEYQEWDILISFDNSCNQCHTFMHYFGVAGIVIDEDFKARVERTSNVIFSRFDADYWGVGLRLGTYYSTSIFDCFKFFANGHVTLLAGDSHNDSKFDSQDADTDIDHRFKEDEFCTIVPGYHLQTGFGYDTCVCGWELGLKIGYEFLAWHNIPSRRIYISEGSVGSSVEAAINTVNDTRVFGFHGLFLGAKVVF